MTDSAQFQQFYLLSSCSKHRAYSKVYKRQHNFYLFIFLWVVTYLFIIYCESVQLDGQE